jgi:hypothetical protein
MVLGVKYFSKKKKIVPYLMVLGVKYVSTFNETLEYFYDI